MAEPNAGICAATVATGGLCTLTGMQLDLMVLASFGAVMVSYILPQIDDRKRAFAAVFFGIMVGTYSPPFIALAVAKRLTDGQLVEGLPQTLALIVGGLVPVLMVPFIKKQIRELGNGDSTT